jgi:hypothetical protein
MTKKKTTKEDVEDLQSKIDNEGFGYYFMEYTSNHIPEIQKEADAFDRAGKALKEKLDKVYEKFGVEEL